MSYRFQVADLNAIETRVGAWLAGCQSLLDVFTPLPGRPNGRDPYLAFASKMYGISLEMLEADYEGKNGTDRKIEAKLKRQIAKVGVLAAIYRLGPGKWVVNLNGDRVKTGLFDYADKAGVDMSQEQAAMVVRMFRETYSEIPEFWKTLENAVMDVMNPKATNTVRKIGPGGCLVIDRLNIENRHPLMRMTLPSGRRLHYLDAHIKPIKMPWDHDGEEVWRDGLVYANADQTTGNWGETHTHGGKLFENAVQGIARDVLGLCLLEFDRNDISLVAHVHDEGVAEVLDDPFSFGVDKMVEIMSTPISWAPGLLLGADGHQSKFYHK